MFKCLMIVFSFLFHVMSVRQPFDLDSGPFPRRTHDTPPLLAHWKLNGDGLDSSGNNIHLTVHGDFNDDRWGNVENALHPDSGAGAVHYLANNNVFPAGNLQMSVSMWVYSVPGVWLSEAGRLFRYGGCDINKMFGIDLTDAATPRIRAYTWVDDVLVDVPSLPRTGWFHLVVTHNTNNVFEVYVNGDLVSSQAHVNPLTVPVNQPIEIGSTMMDCHDDTLATGGKVHDVRVYDGILSQNAVDDLYHEGENGLIFHYPLNGDISDGRSDPWTRNLPATLFGSPGPTPTTDRYGVPQNAMYFDGSSYATIPNTGTNGWFSGADALTLSFWFKVSTWQNNRVPVFLGGLADGGYLAVDMGSGVFGDVEVWSKNTMHLQENFPGAMLEKWYHMAVTVLLYIEGELLGSTASSVPLNFLQGDFYLGAAGWDGAKFHGSLDDLRIYNRKLLPAEITELARFEREIAHWPLEGSGEDTSGWGHHLTFQGAPAIFEDDRWGNSGGSFMPNGASYGEFALTHNRDFPSGNFDMTVSLWVYTVAESWANTKGRLFTYGGTGLNEAFGLDIAFSGQRLLRFWTYFDDVQADVGSVTTDEGWHFLAVTFDSATKTATLFVNGDAVRTQAISGTLNVPPLSSIYIGNDWGSSELVPGARIHDVRVFDYVRTGLWVKREYRRAAKGNPLFHFPLSGDINQARNDQYRWNLVGVENGGFTTTTNRFGAAGGAYSFTGSNHISIPHNDGLPVGNEPWTFSIWAKVSPSWVTNRHLIAYGENVVRNAVVFGLDDANDVQFSIYGVDGIVPSDHDVNDWFQMVLSSDGSDPPMIRGYIDGVMVSEMSPPGPMNIPTATPVLVGCLFGNTFNYYGSLNDLRIYDYCLSDDEVNDLFVLESPPSCTNCKPERCISHNECLECEDGWIGLPTCLLLDGYCGSFRVGEAGICGGHGSCNVAIEECYDCELPFRNVPEGDQLCEVFLCHETDSFLNACSERGECKYRFVDPIWETYCECDSSDENGHFGGDHCETCALGYTVDSGCTEMFCYMGTLDISKLPDKECICVDDDVDGHWTGDRCTECMDNYFGPDCLIFCECISDSGVPSGECVPDGGGGYECECYQDFTNGWFTSDPGKQCNRCLQIEDGDSQVDIGGDLCLYGMYIPGVWYTPDVADNPNRLYFSKDFDKLFGYYTTDGDLEGSCDQIIASESSDKIDENCVFQIFLTNEVIYESGIFDFDETVSVLVISGLKDIGLNEEIYLNSEIDVPGNRRSVSAIQSVSAVQVLQFERSFSIFDVEYVAPPPKLKSVKGPTVLTNCEWMAKPESERNVHYRVFAESFFTGNPDNIWFSAESANDGINSYLSSISHLFPMTIMDDLIIPHSSFTDVSGYHDIHFTVVNLFEKTDNLDITVFVEQQPIFDFYVEGTGYYTFRTSDVEKIFGSLVIRATLCGDPVVDHSQITTTISVLEGQPIGTHVDVSPERIDFYVDSFFVFNEEYKIEITVTFSPPGYPSQERTQIVTVLPEAGPLVLDVISSIQAKVGQTVTIDASNSYDPVNSNEPYIAPEWLCTPGCSQNLIATDNDFVVKINEYEMEPGNYEVSLSWVKGNRISQSTTRIQYYPLRPGSSPDNQRNFFFIDNFDEKEFCISESSFNNEVFYFYLPEDENLNRGLFRKQQLLGNVELHVTLESNSEVLSWEYFTHELPLSRPAWMVWPRNGMAKIENGVKTKILTYENDIGRFNVTLAFDDGENPLSGFDKQKHQFALLVNFDFFEDHLTRGENFLTVRMRYNNIVGETTARFVVNTPIPNRIVRQAIRLEKVAAYHPYQRYRSFDCSSKACEHRPAKIFAKFDFPDGFYMHYSFDYMVKNFTGVGLEYEMVRETRLVHIDYTQPWAELHYSRIIPGGTSGEMSFTEVMEYEMMIEGTEQLKIFSSRSDGCVNTIPKGDSWFENDPGYLYSATGERRKVELNFLSVPPFDVSPKTEMQKLAYLLRNMSDVDQIVTQMGVDLSILESVFNDFDKYLSLCSAITVPSVTLYEIELKIHEIFTRLVIMDLGVLQSCSVDVNSYYLDILEIEKNMLLYHGANLPLRLLPNSNLNLIFSTVENILYGVNKLRALESYSEGSVVSKTSFVKKLFFSATTAQNLDTYEEDTQMTSRSNSAMNLFHSKLVNEQSWETLAGGENLKLSGADSCKIFVSKQDYSLFEEDGMSGSEAVRSSFITLNTNNEGVRNPLGIEFNLGDQLLDLKDKVRRTTTVYRPYCMHYEDGGWVERAAGDECIGLSDFYNKLSGSVYCNYVEVPYDTSFVAALREFPGCQKRETCPVEVSSCSEFVQHNMRRQLTSNSKKVNLSPGWFNDLQIIEGNDGERRKIGEDLKTVKSICANKYVTTVVDSDYTLWMLGRSDINDYFTSDVADLVEIPLLDWGEFAPKKVVCTESSVFVLAYNSHPLVRQTKVFAFGRNENNEIGVIAPTFIEFADNVFDVHASRHSVYIVSDNLLDLEDRYVIQARGRNVFGALGTNSYADKSEDEFQDVVMDNFPVGSIIPEVIALDSGVFFRYRNVSEDLYFFAGRRHPTTNQDEVIPQGLSWGEGIRIDFITRIFDTTCTYFYAENSFWVAGGEDCVGMGVSPNLIHNTEPHKFTRIQMGDRFECDTVFDFVCGSTCFIICQHEDTVKTYTFGKRIDSVFMNCEGEEYCETVTYSGMDYIAVYPTMQPDASENVIFVNRPSAGINTIEKTTSYQYPPEIVFEESGFNNNVLKLVLKKPFVFGEAEPELRFVVGERDMPDFVQDPLHLFVTDDACIFPFFERSYWDFWNIEDDEGASWDYYEIGLSWDAFRTECNWNVETRDDYEVYYHRLLFVENFDLGREYGKIMGRSEEFFFDLQVRFPRVVLKTNVIVEKGEFDWTGYILEKTFDRATREGQIVFAIKIENPNYFVFHDNVEEGGDSLPLERIELEGLQSSEHYVLLDEFSVIENGEKEMTDVDHSGLDCGNKYCIQEYILSFQIIKDHRVCSIPKLQFPVNFARFCASGDGMNDHDCVVEEVKNYQFRIEIEIDSLCSGLFEEIIETDFYLTLWNDWTYTNQFEDSHVFRLNDWIYVLTEVVSEKVTIEALSFNSVSFAGEELFGADTISPFGELVSLVIDDLESTTRRGFHFQVNNKLTQLQPSDIEEFSLIVMIEVLYEGNLSPVVSDDERRTFNNAKLSHTQPIKIKFFDDDTGKFEAFPYVVAMGVLFIGTVVAVTLLVFVVLTLSKYGRFRKIFGGEKFV